MSCKDKASDLFHTRYLFYFLFLTKYTQSVKLKLYLHIVESLPLKAQRKDPYQDRANTVQDHSCCSAHFFCNADTGKIEESNTEGYTCNFKLQRVRQSQEILILKVGNPEENKIKLTNNSYQQSGTVSNLDESFQRGFKCAT